MSAHESGLTCIHASQGLCPDCEAEYDADPVSWIEFGRHQDGIARWEALEAEIAANHGWTGAAVVNEDIPF